VWEPFGATPGIDTKTLAEWRAAARSAPPFLSAEFFLETAELIGCAPIIGVGRTGGLSAFLPLCRRGRVLAALRSDQSPRFDLTGDHAALPAVWDSMLERPNWDLVVLRSVSVTSPLVRDLPRLAKAAGCEVVVRPIGQSPYFTLDDFERELDGRFRRDIARRMRKLGQASLERLTDYDSDAMEEAFELEATAWKRDAGTAIACHPRERRFYHAIARHLAGQGRLALSFLRVGDRRVAVHIAAEDDESYYLLKHGYSQEMASFGVGHVLVQVAAVDARERGLRRFDCLGRESEWKRRWTHTALPQAELRIYRNSVLGRVRHALTERLRPAAGRGAHAVRGALLRDRSRPHGRRR
jgi:CelD/BcsL family acetyltransferase involved in cellulose biosynthesis